MKNRTTNVVCMIVVGLCLMGGVPLVRAQCQVDKVTASSGNAGDRYGWSVAASGDYAVVGADIADGGGSVAQADTGAAYLLRRDGLKWVEVQQLVANDPLASALDEFGASVAISENAELVAVGALKATGVNNVFRAGAVYVFRRYQDSFPCAANQDCAGVGLTTCANNVCEGLTWAIETKLLAKDPHTDDEFGISVDISGDVVVVGADRTDQGIETYTGAAYVYRRYQDSFPCESVVDCQLVGLDTCKFEQGVCEGVTWLYEQRLIASDATSAAFFGGSVSAEENRIVVGAKSIFGPGGAYVYEYNGATWDEIQKLTASDGQDTDAFGQAVDLYGDTIVVTAMNADPVGVLNAGKAYVYRRIGSAFGDERILTASNGLASDRFGRSASLHGNNLIIGARDTDVPASRAGSAYLFSFDGTNWNEIEVVLAADGEGNDRFGHAVSLSENYGMVGAYREDDAGLDAGAAYMFAIGLGRDCNDNLVPDDCDVLAGTEPDQNNNGTPDACECQIDEDCVGLGVECSDATCNHVNLCELAVAPGFCRIGGVCYADGEANPSNPCQTCDSSVNQRGFIALVCEDDGNACTTDVCVSGFCNHQPRPAGTACGDPADTECNPADSCSSEGVCVEMVAQDGQPCTRDVPDNNICTEDICDSGLCVASDLPAGVPCPDDGNPCTGNVCDGAGNCGVNLPDGAACTDDGSYCTLDVCSLGLCVHQPLGGDSSCGTQCQVDKVTAPPGGLPNSNDGDRYGWSVAVRGDYAVVGADRGDGGGITPQDNTGAVFLLQRNGLNWVEIQKLVANDDLAAYDDAFGASVAMADDAEFIVVGATAATGQDNVREAGAVYVFKRYQDNFPCPREGDCTAVGLTNCANDVCEGIAWVRETILRADDPATLDAFGYSVDISGDVVVVGADRSDTGTDANAGSAYVFRRYQDNFPCETLNDCQNVELSTCVLGANVCEGVTWQLEQKLTASDAAANSFFGNSVSIEGNRIAVGARGGTGPGGVYIFEHSESTWSEVQKLTASDGQSGDAFGQAVDLHGDAMVVTAMSAELGDVLNAGKVYVYRRVGNTFGDERILTASNPARSDRFGRSASLRGDNLLIGTRDTDVPASRAGSAYLFNFDGSDWNEIKIIQPTDIAGDDRFGTSVSLSETYGIIGAYKEDDAGVDAGAAYVFAIGLGRDCNDNSIPDDCDVIDGTVPDTNNNGTPDPCECQGDGDCSIGDECSSEFCNRDLLCEFSINVDRCSIDGVCYNDGEANPNNSCQACNASIDQGRFTSAPGAPPCDDDENECTLDVCSLGFCGHQPLEGSACGDQADTECSHPDTCSGEGTCDVNDLPKGTACTDDGNACTNDVCDGAGVCDHPSLAAGTACGDPADSMCDNADTCDGAGNCQSNIPEDGTNCDDQLFCTGHEICVQGVCQSSGDPCGGALPPVCDEGLDGCFFPCQEDANCDDNNACTNDHCERASCVNPPTTKGASCGDATSSLCDRPDFCDGLGNCLENLAPDETLCSDELFCNGKESCAAGVCIAAMNPCAGSDYPVCDEEIDACLACSSDSDCDDQLECFDDICFLGQCIHPWSAVDTPCGDQESTPCDRSDTCDGFGTCIDHKRPDGASCDDGFFCTGVDICLDEVCTHDGNNCSNAGLFCDELADRCSENPTANVIYSNNYGQAHWRPQPTGIPVADDIVTSAVGECKISAVTIRVNGGIPGGGGLFAVTTKILDGCPNLPGSSIIPNTERVFDGLDDNDAIDHDLHLIRPGEVVMLPPTFWIQVRFSTSQAYWYMGTPATTGFSGDWYDHPFTGYNTWFGGWPTFPNASGYAVVRADEPCPTVFPAYRAASPTAPVYVPPFGPASRVADDLSLVVDDCVLGGYELGMRGIAGPYQMSMDLRATPEGSPIPGTEHVFEGKGEGSIEVTRFTIPPETEVPIPAQLWMTWQANKPATGVLNVGRTQIGQSLPTFAGSNFPGVPGWTRNLFLPDQDAVFYITIFCRGEEPYGACCPTHEPDTAATDCQENLTALECAAPDPRCGVIIDCPGVRWSKDRCCGAECCVGGDNDNQTCTNNADCPGGSCLAAGDPPAFDPPCGSHACCSWDGTCEDTSTNDCIGQHHQWRSGAFCFEMPCAHVSDDCTDALALETVDECPDNATLCVALSNAGATSSANDPGYCCYADMVDAAGDRTIWFSFEATATSARIETCGTTGAFGGDSLLQLFEAGDPSTPEAACTTLMPVACSDNAASCGIDGRGSRIDASGLIVGSTYYVELASKTAADAGEYTLSVTLPSPATEPPTNDTCEGALAVDIGSWLFDIDGATTACPLEPCSQEMQGDVWFEYTALEDGVLSVDACIPNSGSSITASLAIYGGTGCALDSDSRVVCQSSTDSACPDGVLAYLYVETGTTYTIRVGGDFIGLTAGSLTLALVTDCQPNGIPDVCDIDCGAEGGPCDIPFCGQSEDINADGVPDDCVQPMRTFVDVAATGANDGSSWADAFVDLQDGLAAVGGLDCCAAGGCAIWVAPGVYKPDRGTGDRYLSFALMGCVTLRAVSRARETVLSGDLLGDDGPDFANYGDNSGMVVCSGCWMDTTTRIDGFTITGGSTHGGMEISGNQSVINCTFRGNRSSEDGGGIRISDGNPTLDNCEFIGNYAAGKGGGIFAKYGHPTLENCVFRGNSASLFGGGMHSERGDPVVTNCIFDNNAAGVDGGGLHAESGNLILTGCVFRNNSAVGDGGGISTGSGSIRNCTFTRNSATNGGGTYGLIHATRCVFDQNTATNDGAGMYGSGSMIDSIFRRNAAARGGGGRYVAFRSRLIQESVTNCVFSGNSAETGGGLYVKGGVSVTNCSFTGNTAVRGRGIGQNLVPGTGGHGPCSLLSNVILADGGDELAVCALVDHSCIQDDDPDDDEVFPGEGNIDDDPLFEDADGPDGIPGTEDDRLHLSPGSPCINAGTNTPRIELSLTDLDGNPRVRDCRVDMGVFEAPAPTPSPPAPPGIIFVMEGAANEDGLTWESAYRYLQDALAAASASAGSINEIWVAAGTYTPDRGEYQVRGDRVATFQLLDGVTIYGGLACGDSNFGSRDPARNLSVLSGDLNSDDGPKFLKAVVNCVSGYGVPLRPGCEGSDRDGDGDVDHDDVRDLLWENNYTENSYHVVSAGLVDDTAVLDGVTIIGGNADGNDGSLSSGGGMNCPDGNPKVVGCRFVGNTADSGGGVCATDSAAPTLIGCSFDGNWASSTGGGAFNSLGTAATYVSCTFGGNSALEMGGGMFNSIGSSTTVANCTFGGNSCVNEGGGMANYASSPQVANCTFAENSAAGLGGGMYNFGGAAPTLTDCILWGNHPAQIDDSDGLVSISNTDIEGGWEGVGNIDADPHFVPGPGGCFYLSASQDVDSPCVDAGSDTAANLGLDVFTTRSDEGTDLGVVDMGYHYAVTGLPLIMGDYDRNQLVNFADFARWASCVTGPGDMSVTPCCRIFDFEADGDVDLDDYAAFELEFSRR